MRPLLWLLIAVCGVGATAQTGGWFAAESRAIRVLSNASPLAANRTLSEIESAETLFKSLVNATPSLPVHAFALKDSDSLREIAPQFWERRGIRPHAIAYAGPHAAFLAVREDLPPAVRREALLHEYVHLLTAAQIKDAPAWLDEGLAEFWASVIINDGRVVVGRPVKKHVARLQNWQPLDQTLRRKRGEFIADSEPSEMFYAQSWAMVHYLLLGPGSRAQLPLVPEHTSLPDDFEQRLREYVSEERFTEVTKGFTAQPPSAPTPSYIPESRALAERARMLVFGPRPDAAVALAKRALAVDPRESLALEVTGTYFFLNNKPAEARMWLTRAFDTGSATAAAALYLALLAPTAADRERYLAAAVTAQPDNEVAWQRLLEIYKEDGRLQSLRESCRMTTWPVLLWLSIPSHACEVRR